MIINSAIILFIHLIKTCTSVDSVRNARSPGHVCIESAETRRQCSVCNVKRICTRRFVNDVRRWQTKIMKSVYRSCLRVSMRSTVIGERSDWITTLHTWHDVAWRDVTWHDVARALTHVQNSDIWFKENCMSRLLCINKTEACRPTKLLIKIN